MTNQNIKISVLSSICLAFVVSCTGRSDKPNIELIQDMMEQPAVKAQEYDDFFADKAGGARVPPANTQPVGHKPYRFATDAEGAKNNPNPYAGSREEDILAVGQKYYQTHCAVCHGETLKADTVVAGKMPVKPPHLDTDKIKGWTDGQIYHVITVGQGVMGPYASHIPQAYRWQVVNYIRYLQENAK